MDSRNTEMDRGLSIALDPEDKMQMQKLTGVSAPEFGMGSSETNQDGMD